MPDVIEEAELGEQFSSSVIDSFKRGSQKGIGNDNIFESFNFSSDPFDITNLISYPNLITKKIRDIVTNLAERIGACYKTKAHLIVVSPEGMARTTVLRLLNATFNKGLDKNFSLYVDAPKTWSGFSLEENNEGERIDNFQKWMQEVNFSNTKIVLIDDSDAVVSSARQYADAIKFEHIETPTMVYCITPTTQSLISKSDLLKNFFADTFWITRLEDKDIKEIILKSIDRFKTSNSSPFDELAVDMIVKYSLGLPGAATHLALLCLKTAYQIGTKTIDKSIVESVASNEGYDIALKVLHQKIKLDGTKYKIVVEILTQSYIREGSVERTIIISKFSHMAPSTLSYHLKDLINDGILKQERIGYKVYYFIPKILRSALQLLIMFASSYTSPSSLGIGDVVAVGGNNN
jgi:DNA-binding transcriptional ArsR family regulator